MWSGLSPGDCYGRRTDLDRDLKTSSVLSLKLVIVALIFTRDPAHHHCGFLPWLQGFLQHSEALGSTVFCWYQLSTQKCEHMHHMYYKLHTYMHSTHTHITHKQMYEQDLTVRGKSPSMHCECLSMLVQMYEISDHSLRLKSFCFLFFPVHQPPTLSCYSNPHPFAAIWSSYT